MGDKVVIAGGTGFIGQFLQKRFQEDGYTVVLISRQKGHVDWKDQPSLTDAIDNAKMLINLAGKPINTRFTTQNKINLVSSRVSTTEILGNALLKCTNPPDVWMNASGAHIYGPGDAQKYTESDKLNNEFFPALMAQKWEDALFQFTLPKTRKVALRISIVLGKEGGVLEPYVMLTKLFLGGRQGSGKQKFSWIHLEDFYQILLFVATKKQIEGAINLCSPEVVDNNYLMQLLRKQLHRFFGFPAPAFAIKIGAAMLGIESDLILKSLSVYPQILLDEGYTFKYPNLKVALENILK